MTKSTNDTDEPGKVRVRQRRRSVAGPLTSAPSSQIPAAAPNAGAPGKTPAVPAATSPGAGDDGYAVGYRKPPRHSQFKPGHDPRRPRGRKAGSKNKANSIVVMMESPTAVRTPEGDVRTISTSEAMARKLRELGLSGELGAISKAFELYFKALPPPVPERDSQAAALPEAPAEIAASDGAILAWYEEEIALRGKREDKA